MHKTAFLFIGCLCLLCSAVAQSPIQNRTYPANMFRYPLDLPPTTAGTFGELRANHFHSGLDFKTNQRIGYPVHAVNHGYISRLRLQIGGFGNAVYITHPGGYVSVYGHLDHLSPELAKAVRDYQYAHQQYEVDFKPEAFLFPVIKGQVFAWSGNTGASAGPHVHFEIRDSVTEETINPQLFGLTIADRVPPAISSITLYHLNGQPFSEHTPRQYLGVAGAAGAYHLTQPQALQLSGDIGFGITAIDQNSTSVNRNGIYSLELKLDGKTVYTFAVERFAFDQTHAINAYIDYPQYILSHRWIQKCFLLPGSHISLYPQSVNRGVMSFRDTLLHEVEYTVKDVAGNTSTVKFDVQAAVPKDSPIVQTSANLFKYNQRNEFNADNVKVVIAPGNLYDDLNFTYTLLPRKAGAYSATHRIHNRLTPLHDTYDLWIKPDASISSYAGKAVIVNTLKGVVGGIYQDGYVKTKPTIFGDFFIRLDTVAPKITPVNIANGSNLAAARTLNIKISDNLSGIKTYNGYIDGEWVLMTYSPKYQLLKHTFNNQLSKGKHTFELTVNDNKDNTAHYKADFYK